MAIGTQFGYQVQMARRKKASSLCAPPWTTISIVSARLYRRRNRRCKRSVRLWMSRSPLLKPASKKQPW